jgi:hypothetical protein
MRLAPERLKFIALAALEEAAEGTHQAPVEPSYALRFALAYLYAISGEERWPFDGFWQAATRDWGKEEATRGAAGIGRSQSTNACLNAIYRALRMKRDYDAARAIIHQDRKP